MAVGMNGLSVGKQAWGGRARRIPRVVLKALLDEKILRNDFKVICEKTA